MTAILGIIGPVFIIIGIGYLAVRTGLLPRQDVAALGRFVLYFALPTLLFKALSERSAEEVLNLGFLIAYGAGSLVAMLFGVLHARMQQGRDLQAGAMHGLGMSVSNGFIAYPLILQFLGPPGIIAVALAMVVDNFLIIPLVLALAEGGARGERRTGALMLTIAARLARNPIILSIFAGMVFAMLELRLPAVLGQVLDMFAGGAAAVALFVIGGTLVGQKVGGMLGQISIIMVGKLVIHPLAVLAALLLLPPIDPMLTVAAVTIACIPMLSIFPILGQRYGLQGMCAAALMATTTASLFTITLALWVIDRLGVLTP